MLFISVGKNFKTNTKKSQIIRKNKLDYLKMEIFLHDKG